MSRIQCDVEYTSEENDYGTETDCVYVTCSRCDHEVHSWGDGDASVKRCLAVMREECPYDEDNYYTT